MMESKSNATVPGHRARSSGFTLVELMVALAISSFLLIGATTVYMQSRTSFRVTETISRLQEDARFALDLLEADIRMASYYGLQSRPLMVANKADALEAVPPGLGVANECRQNWAIDLELPIEVSNNAYPAWNADCAAEYGVVAASDAIVVRRVSEDPVAVLGATTLHLQAHRFRTSLLFVGTAVPAGFPAAESQTHELIVNGYYVSQGSDGDPTVPSLRRYTLTDGAGGPQVIPEEILPGVEDMQIQLGVDTDRNGSVDRYVNADDPILVPRELLAVRVWLLVRAEQRENGFEDGRAYVYADRNMAAPMDAFRRMLVSRTILLRNARTAD